MDLRDRANGKETTADELLEAIDALRANLSNWRDADGVVDELLAFVDRHPEPAKDSLAGLRC